MYFETSEYQARAERLRSELNARNLDAILIDDCEATAYYFNYDTSVSFYRAGFIPARGETFFVLRSLDVAPLTERAWFKDIVGYPDTEDPVRFIAEQLRRRGLDRARIGVDFTSHALTVRAFEALKRELPQAVFVDLDALLWKMRKLKSKAEIERLRKMAAINDVTMQEIVKAVKPGYTDRDALCLAVESLGRHGADPGSLALITAGKGWGFLHGNIHENPLQEGDVLSIELYPRFKGYSSRIMRCVVVGDIPAKLGQLSKKIIELQDKQIAAMKPGAIAKDVDRIMRQGALDAGIREDYTNVTGYTLGYYSSRLMRASDFTWAFLPNAEWVLQEGMVFHMYASGGGLSISETVLVGPNGGERLNKLERQLFSSNDA